MVTVMPRYRALCASPTRFAMSWGTRTIPRMPNVIWIGMHSDVAKSSHHHGLRVHTIHMVDDAHRSLGRHSLSCAASLCRMRYITRGDIESGAERTGCHFWRAPLCRRALQGVAVQPTPCCCRLSLPVVPSGWPLKRAASRSTERR